MSWIMIEHWSLRRHCDATRKLTAMCCRLVGTPGRHHGPRGAPGAGGQTRAYRADDSHGGRTPQGVGDAAI